MAKFREVRLTDWQLDACCHWSAPDVAVLPLPYVLPFYRFVLAGAVLPEIEIASPMDFPFMVEVLSNTSQSAQVGPTLLQIQWPDGRYLSNPGFDLANIGTGRRGRLIDPGKVVQPAQKIRLGIDNSGGMDVDLQLFFEGRILVPLVKK